LGALITPLLSQLLQKVTRYSYALLFSIYYDDVMHTSSPPASALALKQRQRVPTVIA